MTRRVRVLLGLGAVVAAVAWRHRLAGILVDRLTKVSGTWIGSPS